MADLKTTNLHQKIRQVQILAGEQAVIDHLREMGVAEENTQHSPRDDRGNFRQWEKYVTCCNCSHPLDDNQRMKDALKTNTTASLAKVNLKILSEMAKDRGLPEWFVNEVKRIEAGITLIPDANSEQQNG